MRTVVEEVKDLCRGAAGPQPALPDILEIVARRWGCVSGATRPILSSSGWKLEFSHFAGCDSSFQGRVDAMSNELLGRVPDSSWKAYNPLRPEPEQRNRIFDGAWLHARVPELERIYRSLGLADADHRRVLVCDGPLLLTWFGVWRERPFEPEEVEELRAILGVIGRRVRAELDSKGSARGDGLEQIDHLSAPAFLLEAGGACRHANEAGELLLEKGDSSVQQLLDEFSREGQHLRATGLPELVLVTPRCPGLSWGMRLSSARRRWNLTARQSEVLGFAARGDSNKEIAEKLACEVGTVEIHMSAILSKARVESRSRLLAKFWSEAP